MYFDIKTAVNNDDHLLIKNIKNLYKDLNSANYQDIYNDACIIKDEVSSAFKLGVLNMLERSIAETLYWNICHKIIEMTENEKYVPSEIKKINRYIKILIFTFILAYAFLGISTYLKKI